MLAIVIGDLGRKCLDHPRLGPIIVAALKAREMAGTRDLPPDFESNVVHITGSADTGALHVDARVPADSRAVALMAVTLIYEAAVADGHKAFVRVAPEAESQRDFTTDAVEHRGCARFTLLAEKGAPVTFAQLAPFAMLPLEREAASQ